MGVLPATRMQDGIGGRVSTLLPHTPGGVMKSLGLLGSEPRGDLGASDCETGHKGGMGIFSMVKGLFMEIIDLLHGEFLKILKRLFGRHGKR